MSDANISTMDLKQLRKEVQLLRDELAITKRNYEDILYNLDDANFSERFVKEKDNMKTAITITAEGIETKVSKDEFESQMMQTASLIATKVSNTELGKYSTTAQTENLIQSAVNALGDEYVTNSAFEQRANSIKMSVNAMYSNPVEVDGFNQFNADENKVYYDTSENTYWYFDGEEWCESNNANFGTVFEQTSTGFALKGNVTIDGSLVTNISKVNNALYLGDEETSGSKMITFNNMAKITSVADGMGSYGSLKVSAVSLHLSDAVYIGDNIVDDNKLATQSWVKANAGSGGGTAVAVFG